MAKPRRKIDEVFPILAIEEGLIISKNADISVPYELRLPEIFTASGAEYDRMHQAFFTAIQGMHANYVIHKQDWYTVQKYVPDFKPFHNSPVSLGRSDERHFAERDCINHRCLLFITRPMDMALKKRSSQSSLLSPRLVPREVTEYAYRQELIESAEKFIRTLEESGLIKAIRLKEEEIDYQLTKESIYQNYLSLSREDTAMTDIELNEFKVNGQYVGITAIGELCEFPQHIANTATIEKYKMGKHFISGSLGYKVGMSLPFNHIYNQIFYIDHTEKLLKELEAEANRMTSLSLKSSQNVFNLQLKLEFIQKAVKMGGKVIRTHANVITWHSERSEMLKQRSMVSAGFSSMNFTPRQAVSDAPVLYWSCMPGNAAEIGKDNLAICFAEEGTCLMALESNYTDKHYGKYGVKLTDRYGAPRCVDIFMKPYDAGIIDNRNTVFVGPSGSGKSFLMNLILYYMLEQDSNVIMVDTGNSYKRLCAMMGGVYVTFDKDHPLSFNPFYWESSKLSADEVSDSKQNVVSLLLSLWKKDTDNISKSEEVGIENLVNAFYADLEINKKNPFPCFNSFFDFFQNKYLPNVGALRIRPEDIDLENFRFVMERFYAGNYFGHLLNAGPDNQINRLLDERLVVFEMDNIKNSPTLHNVTTMAIMTLYVRKLMRKHKAIFNLLVIEEAWRLVKDPRFAEFLKWVSKTARKHHGSLITVTQEPTDLQSEVVKEAIIRNSAIKILLDFSQYKNQAPAVQEILGLSNEETTLLMSLNQGRDTERRYKEVFISWNGYAKIYGTEVSRESYAAFTTRKDEVSAIENLRNKYGSYQGAVVAFSRGDHLIKPVQITN